MSTALGDSVGFADTCHMTPDKNGLNKSINDKYLMALEVMDSWLTVSEWAQKVAEIFPDLLEKAEIQAAGQKNETTGLREIAARLSSQISRGAFGNLIEIDSSERPKKVRWVSKESAIEHEQLDLEEDLEPFTRNQKIKQQYDELTVREKYRYAEFDGIIRQLNSFFGTDFELDHAKAILNKSDPGDHHPDNFQILTKSHNRKKSGSNWGRFTLEQQLNYIKSVLSTQKFVTSKMNLEMSEDVFSLILERINRIY